MMLIRTRLVERRETFNDQPQAKNLIAAGNRHIENEDFDRLDEVIGCLCRLLPQDDEESREMRRFLIGIR
jgi:hypothetical protein